MQVHVRRVNKSEDERCVLDSNDELKEQSLKTNSRVHNFENEHRISNPQKNTKCPCSKTNSEYRSPEANREYSSPKAYSNKWMNRTQKEKQQLLCKHKY
jgi:hypothetical protein